MKKNFALAVLAGFSLSALAAPKDPAVTLNFETVNNGTVLTPNSAFELRFAEPMVKDEVVGKEGVAMPLVFEPALTGKWVWVSTQSGVYTLTEPPPLNTSYKVSLTGGLSNAAGKAFGGSLKEDFQSPVFRAKGWSAIDYSPVDNALAVPRFSVAFSAGVDAAAIAGNIWFTDATGRKVPSVVDPVDVRGPSELIFPPYRADDKNADTWEEAFRKARLPEAQKPSDDEGDEDPAPVIPPGGPILKHQIVVKPQQPLAPGKGWKMIIAQGLPSTGGLKLAAPMEVEIGEVKPFVVDKVTVENLVYSGKRLQIKFTKPIGKAARKDPAKFIKVEPAVPDLKIALPTDMYDEFDTLVVSGKFELAKDYTISIGADLPAKEPFTLGQAVTKKVSFAPVPSRLYFQDFATHQQRSGSRTFHLMGVNVQNVRIAAKVVPAASVPAALNAWKKYYREDGPDADEWLTKVDEKTIPGSATWTREIPLAAQMDEKKLLPLKWDDILGAGKTGTVLLTAEQVGKPAPNVKRAGVQALVQVTDLGVVWKASGDYFFHIFSLATAEPVKGATLKFLDEEGSVIAETKTAADGTARIPKPVKKEGEEEDATEPAFVQITNGTDQLLVDFYDGREDLEFSRFRINVWGDEEDIMLPEMDSATGLRGLLFSDRPVYRPGETAHVKGIIRNHEPGAAHIPAGKVATVRVKGPRNRTVLEQKVTLSDTGSFAVDVALPKEVVGYFRAVLLTHDEEDDEWSDLATGFTVQEYQPNAFEIKIAAPPAPLLGQAIEIPLSAKYYMGKALSKSQLSWTVRASDETFAPEGFEDFSFNSALNDWRLEQKLGGESRFATQSKVELSPEGTAKAQFTVPVNPRIPQPRTVRFMCEVTDLNQQTVAERQEFTMHSSDFYLGLFKGPEVIREGDVLPLQLVAVGSDGKPFADAVETSVKLTRIDWQTNRVEEADSADNFRSEPQMQPVGEIPVRTIKPVQQGGKWKLPADAPVGTFKADKPGLYLVTATAKDAGGRQVVTTAPLYVHGKDQLAWNYRNKFQVELVADKPEYRVGEKATILVKTPISGPALVTVERENVRRHFFVKLEGNAPAVEVPIEEADAPNVYVSVLALRGAQDSPKKFKAPEYRVGYVQLAVKRPDAKLYVNVKPARPAVQPGEPIEVVAEVRDVDGKPVSNAEVTLWAADEGVLSLTGFETPDPLVYFSRLLRLEVTTGLTLERLLGEDPDERVFENKGFLVGGFGKGGEAGVRRNFLGTAYWDANLRTDPEGNVRANFPAPDGLTRYRVMAVAQTKRDQFGNGQADVEINKPLMLEPAPPRFANVGDKMLVRAVVHNTTADAGAVTVTLAIDDKGVAAEKEKTVQVPANGSVAVDFPVEFVEVGTAKWTWRASMEGAAKRKDAVESQFVVGYPVPLLREIKQTRADADADLLAGLDPALLQGKGVVKVSISNSRVFELREGVSELLHYPYGCVEQTTSAMLPWLALRDFRTVLPELSVKDAEFKTAIEKGIARIFTMQTGNGGLAYWPGGRVADFWGSAYGAYGLALAKRAGFDVPEEDYNKLLAFLSQQLRGAADSNDKWALSPRALACFALATAGQPEEAYHEVLFKKRTVLTQESRALVALAILESKGQQKMAEALLRITDKAAEEDFWFGSVARAQGVRLLAWSRLSPKSTATDQIAQALFDLRQAGSWQTTQGNVWAVLGLSEYIRKTEADRKAVKGNIAGAEFNLGAKGAYFQKEFPLGAPVKLTNPGKGRLFAQVTLEARPKTLVAERQDRGYTVTRTYQRINDDGSLADLGEPKVGDRVLVTLNIAAPAQGAYVVIDDPLPAVFEAVNPEFKSQEMAGGQRANVFASDFNEIRTDRALFFANSFFAGKHEIRYLARVRAAGEATAPPTKVEQMYHPERFGLGPTTPVKAKGL